MENELPKIDLPEDILAGVLNDSTILRLYEHYPCRIKAQMFVLCKKGCIDASINLVDYHISDNSFLVVLQGSILQVNKIEGDVEIYFAGFSSDFLRTINPVKSLIDIAYTIKHNPIVCLPEDIVPIVEDCFKLAIRAFDYSPLENRELIGHLYYSLIFTICSLYSKRKIDTVHLSPAERISQNFNQLVLDNYTREKNVVFYAEKLGITASYLSTVIRETTGKTCLDIISNMVIMDAKAQLKSTNLPVSKIADSLNFNNVSFFGKYFKRYVGISPMEYRNSKSVKE